MEDVVVLIGLIVVTVSPLLITVVPISRCVSVCCYSYVSQKLQHIFLHNISIYLKDDQDMQSWMLKYSSSLGDGTLFCLFWLIFRNSQSTKGKKNKYPDHRIFPEILIKKTFRQCQTWTIFQFCYLKWNGIISVGKSAVLILGCNHGVSTQHLKTFKENKRIILSMTHFNMRTSLSS